jgi:hypothetical protein
MNNPTKKPNADSIERELKALELLSTGALPISALASGLSIIGLVPIGIVSISIGSFAALAFARQYTINRKASIEIKLDELKETGEIADEKYQELKATLNRLTAEGKPKSDSS